MLLILEFEDPAKAAEPVNAAPNPVAEAILMNFLLDFFTLDGVGCVFCKISGMSVLRKVNYLNEGRVKK